MAFTKEMVEKANAAFAGLQDSADTLTAEELAPVVVDLLKELELPEQDAEMAFRRMLAPVESKTEAWTEEGKRGMFIVFEGLDRAGKSTQSRELRAKLDDDARQQAADDGDAAEQQGADEVRWLCFPARDTPMGSLINLYLRREVDMPDRAIHLLFSANRWEMANAIIADLNAGRTVVCDRYAFSGVVYTAAKGLDSSWCRTPDIGLPRPDLVFFLYLDPEVGAKRAAFGDERYENAQMQTAVREEFAAANFAADVAWHDMDGAQEKAVISSQIYDVVAQFRNGRQDEGMPAVGRLFA